MNRTLIVNTEARSDVVRQFGYLSEKSSTAAIRFRTAVDFTFRKLTRTPMGQRLLSTHPELQGVRMWRLDGFDNYLAFYRVTDTKLEILRVLHAAQDWMSILENQFPTS